MTEVEKMRSSQLADMSAPELQVRFEHAKKLLARMRGMSTYDEGYRELLDKLVPGIPETSIICPPFHCDHGDGIKLGEHVFVNANCTFLDGGYITIGTHTLVGPCVQIYTPHHPMDYQERRGSKEYAYPVTIGEDCCSPCRRTLPAMKAMWEKSKYRLRSAILPAIFRWAEVPRSVRLKVRYFRSAGAGRAVVLPKP